MVSHSPSRRWSIRFRPFWSGPKRTCPRLKSQTRRSTAIACESLEQRILLSGAPLLRDFTVMSQNLYLGTDLNPIIAALNEGDPNAVVAAATAGWQQVLATDFEERADGLADQILESRPTLIGLQEVALWETGPAFDSAPADTIEFDFLEILLDELAERDLHYTAVAVSTNFSAEVPGLTDPTDLASVQDIRLTDRDVILARADLKTSDLKLSNAQAENFETNLVFDLPPLFGEDIELTRGWTSVDVKIRGKEFRVINTHLELEVPVVGDFFQVAQANELLAGPINTDLPVILLGDFNSRADENEAVYELLLGAGFEDVWTQTHPYDEGFTCCHDADLRNDIVNFDEGRIDWILYRGDFLPLEMDRFNDEWSDRTDSGLWLSDHAGLVASLIVSPLPPVARRFAMAFEDLASAKSSRGALQNTLAEVFAGFPLADFDGDSRNESHGNGNPRRDRTPASERHLHDAVFQHFHQDDLLTLADSAKPAGLGRSLRSALARR